MIKQRSREDRRFDRVGNQNAAGRDIASDICRRPAIATVWKDDAEAGPQRLGRMGKRDVKLAHGKPPGKMRG